MRKMLLTAFAIAALGAAPAVAQNLLANPGFELPTTTTTAMGNWFRFGSGANGSAFDSTTMPHAGQGHIGLEIFGANQFAGVFQNLGIPVFPGQTVTLSGFAKSASGAPFAATQEIKLEWQGTPNPPQNRLDDLTLGSDYEQFSHVGVAPAGTTGLVVTYAISTFGGGQGDSLVYLDDMSVTIVPEPATVALMGLGGLAVVAMRRRRK